MPKCIICQKEFQLRDSHPNQTVCSPKCRYLRNLRLQKVRRAKYKSKYVLEEKEVGVQRFEYYCPKCKDSFLTKLPFCEAICIRCGYSKIQLDYEKPRS